MKAAQISTYGDSSVISIADIETPQPNDRQVLINVAAASLNPVDSMVRNGFMKASLQLPITLGGDIAGTVTALGDDALGFAVGDRIYGQASVLAGNSGSFAEYAATSADQIARAPKNTSTLEAASLPLVGVSALQAISTHLQLKPGSKLLIHGGSGGIGSIAIQLAKHLGLYVATTVPSTGLQLAKELGADEVIDFTTQDFTSVVHDFDGVFDTAGGDVFAQSFACLKPGGMAVSMIAPVDETLAQRHNVTALTQQTKVNTDALNELTQLVEDGIVTPRIGKVFPLEQVQDAFLAREKGGLIGKVVLEINQQ